MTFKSDVPTTDQIPTTISLYKRARDYVYQVGFTLPPEVDPPFDNTRILRSGWKDSVSTPGYHSKQTVRKLWVPKKYPLRPPVTPRFNPPRLPVRKKARPGASKRSLRNLERKFQLRYAKAVLKRASYMLKYNERVAKYNKRKAKFELLSDLMAHGKLGYRMVPIKTKRTLSNNPFSKAYIHATGWMFDVDYEIQQTYNRNAEGKIVGWYPGPGFVYELSRLKGYFGRGVSPPSSAIDTLWPLSYQVLNPAPLEKSAESQCISKLYSKLNDQEVHVANMIAERAQSLGMLADLMRKATSLLRSPKRFVIEYFKNGAIAARNISNDFLAYQFGMRPLVSDAYGIVQTLKRWASDTSNTKVVIRSNSTQTDSYNGPGYWMSNGPEMYREAATDICTSHISVKVSYVLEYRIEDGLSSNLQRLGLINPLEVAWEMVPWSFVVDWFLPIGSYINSFSSPVGLQFVTGTRTVTTTTTYFANRVYTEVGTGTYKNIFWRGSISGNYKSVTKVRTVLTGPPSAQFPQLKNPFSALHLSEAFALLVQKSSRVKPSPN